MTVRLVPARVPRQPNDALLWTMTRDVQIAQAWIRFEPGIPPELRVFDTDVETGRLELRLGRRLPFAAAIELARYVEREFKVLGWVEDVEGDARRVFGELLDRQ